MQIRVGVFALVIAACSSGRAPTKTAAAPARAVERRLSTIPDDPCELLTSADVSKAAGISIQSARRVPDIGEIVRAQRENRVARAGNLCNYDSTASIGDIVVAVPDISAQSIAAFRKEREEYSKNFRAESIVGVGYEAWLAGGNTLHVLAARNLQFVVATRYWQPDSRDAVVRVAKLILSRISQ
ncbi:MAG TPA: hypothetical protein VM099_02505 [Gemmatimonadaceae bacterium]|nr:hypothetical protein [Gemmatimonadaceae bacterium]